MEVIKLRDKIIYINNLINRIYKILPLSEENSNIVPELYLEILIDDMVSANELFDGILIEIITQLNRLNRKNTSHKKIKSIVFDSITLCKKVAENIKDIEEGE